MVLFSSSHRSWWSLTSEFEDKNWQIPLTHLVENVVTTNQSERREQLHPTGQSLEHYSLGIYLEITFCRLPNSTSAQEVPTKWNLGDQLSECDDHCSYDHCCLLLCTLSKRLGNNPCSTTLAADFYTEWAAPLVSRWQIGRHPKYW